MAYIPDKIQLQDTVYKMVQKVNSGLEQLRKTDDTAEELRVTVSGIQTSLSNLQTSVFDSIDDAVATSKSYTDTKTAETYNESKAYTDNLITSITETGVPSLAWYPYMLTATSEGQLDFEIPLSTFDKYVDESLLVVLNRNVLGIDDYEITDNITAGRTLTLKVSPEEVRKGDTIFLVIFKNVPIGAEGTFSGAYLQNNTVLKSKLESALQTEIDKISPMFEQLTTGEKQTITLTRGENIINIDRDSLGKIKFMVGRTVKNLVPLFDSGLWEFNPDAVIESPNRLTIKASKLYERSFIVIDVKENTRYTISVDTNTSYYIKNNKDSTTIAGPIYSGSRTFNVPIGVTELRIELSNNAEYGDFYWENVTLVEGTEPQPFVANVKGVTNPTLVNKTINESVTLIGTFHEGDTVEYENGNFYVTRKWKEIVLTGDESWEYSVSNYIGFKRIQITGLPSNILNNSNNQSYQISSELVKYNGSLLTITNTVSPMASADLYRLQSENSKGILFISVSNTDSGWGDNYTPTADEIKAYFKGWRMFTASTDYTPYNGTGVKAWYPVTRITEVWQSQYGSSTIPTVLASNKDYWQPYRLIYEQATPTTEIVPTTNNHFRLVEGENVLEVSEGMIVREVVTPFVSDTHVFINRGHDSTTGILIYKVDKLLNVRKNGEIDPSWIVQDTTNIDPIYIFGNERYFNETHNYDPAAVYTVDYIPLELYKVTCPIETLQIEYQANIGTVVNKLVETQVHQGESIEDIRRNMVRKNEGVEWLYPTLLNGVGTYSNNKARFCIDSLGFVHLDGMVTNAIANKAIFFLPKGFRPQQDKVYSVYVYIEGKNYTTTKLIISMSGEITIAENAKDVSFSSISPFKAEL